MSVLPDTTKLAVRVASRSANHKGTQTTPDFCEGTQPEKTEKQNATNATDTEMATNALRMRLGRLLGAGRLTMLWPNEAVEKVFA